MYNTSMVCTYICRVACEQSWNKDLRPTVCTLYTCVLACLHGFPSTVHSIDRYEHGDGGREGVWTLEWCSSFHSSQDNGFELYRIWPWDSGPWFFGKSWGERCATFETCKSALFQDGWGLVRLSFSSCLQAPLSASADEYVPARADGGRSCW